MTERLQYAMRQNTADVEEILAEVLAGDDPDSWKNRLQARGLQVCVVLRGLGEYASVQQLVCDHALDACEVDAL